MKIIVDAFGGDNAPLAVLQGCEQAVKEYGVTILLTGDETKIKETAAKANISLNQMEISHTDTVITMCDNPVEVVRSLKDCSMARGLKLLAEGQGDAFLSAGSTGAIVVGASRIVKTIPGIKRAAIATVIPSFPGCFMLMDSGANKECRPEMLTQFGIMGSAYMNKILKVEKPRVALINNGAEESKGTALQLEAYAQLKEAPVHFIGNVEGRDLPYGCCDVAVADGFTGNIVLKLYEGLGSAFSKEIKKILYHSTLTKIGGLLVKKQFNAFKATMDYSEYGGAPLLGISKPVIKAHGSSNAKAFKNAIRQARDCVENDVIGEIEESMAQLKAQENAAECEENAQ